MITVPETPEAAVGDLFTAEAVFSLPEETAGGFPLRQYRFSEGIFLQGEVREAENFEITGHSYGPGARISLFRECIASLSDRRLSSDGSALLRALLLGDRTTLPDAVRRDFKTLGISHLLAVSGLHLAVLCGMLSFLLQRLRLPKKLQLPLLALFCLFFMALCGFSGSVCRAGVMYLSALAAPLFKTRGDGITGLFAGGFLILLLSPWRLFDTGLQLSFLAVLGILTLGSLLLKKPSRRSKTENAGAGAETAESGLAATDGEIPKENKWAKFLHKIGSARPFVPEDQLRRHPVYLSHIGKHQRKHFPSLPLRDAPFRAPDRGAAPARASGAAALLSAGNLGSALFPHRYPRLAAAVSLLRGAVF